MKIVYCLNSIRYLGGIQRVTIVKANMLSNIPGYEIYIAVSDNKEGVIVTPLSPKVHLIDLDINYYEDDWKSKFNVLKGIILKRRKHKIVLTKILNKLQPDIVISVGQSEKNFLPDIKGNWKTIREFHFDKKYRIRQAKSLFDKILAYLGDLYDYKVKIKKYDQIVVLTEEDKYSNWNNNKKVSVIPNPITITSNLESNLKSKTVISIGRLEIQKNYSSLIKAFNIVHKNHPDWILEIWGTGSLQQTLLAEIEEENASDHIYLKGYTSDVSKVLSKASIFVLSSLYEGFPLVLLEAMSFGLPVVSYTCPCGPKDAIIEGENGFLVPINDEEILANKISTLIEDQKLREKMGNSAKIRANDFSVEKIIDKWIHLFKELKSK